MAAVDKPTTPEDLESALKQVEVLQNQLATRNQCIRDLEDQTETLRRHGRTDHDRVQELEHQNRLLLQQARNPDSGADWLLDFTLQHIPFVLETRLEDAQTGKPLPLARPELGGGGTRLSARAHATLSAEITRKSCFRFLDLPPEIRNRIYDFAAAETFAVSCMLVYNCEPRFGSWRDEALLRAVQDHNYNMWSTRAGRNRLAMLRISRQVHKEARLIYYRNMSVDMRFLYEPAAQPAMLELFASPFKNKLQFVRHIEVDANVADWFLFGELCFYKTYPLFAEWKSEFEDRHGEYDTNLVQSNFTRIRTLLFNLEAVTIVAGYHHFPSKINPGAIGLEMVTNLIHLSSFEGDYLGRLFPRLNDIVTVNHFGSERIRKTDSHCWELYYSHEKLPTFPDYDLSFSGREENYCNLTTGLMHSKTLKSLTYADREEEESDERNGDEDDEDEEDGDHNNPNDDHEGDDDDESGDGDSDGEDGNEENMADEEHEEFGMEE